MTDEALIDLQHAHVTQETTSGVKGDWFVRKNISSEDLYTLPATISDKDVFIVLRFARQFELVAFNAGIDFQKGKQNALLRDQNIALAAQLEAAVAHSEMLAERVEKFTKGEK